MEINMKRFKFIEHTDKKTGVKEVIALTHYCGETVKASASCNPADAYDFEVGKKLAALRCAMKIADIRVRKAYKADFEIMKELADLNRKNYNEIDAMFLWWAHVKLGYGYDRLKALHHDFAPGLMDLCDRYEIHEPGDNVWLCTKKLLDIGVDVAAWNAELKKEKEEE